MKKRQVVLYIVVMLILLTTSVYATISAELGLKVNADNNTLYAGDEFSITISLKNLDASEGIKAIEGYIDINEDILENLTINSIVTDENGKVKINDNNILNVYDAVDSQTNTDASIILNTNPVSGKGDYKIVINLATPLTTDTDLFDIKFQIKDDVAAGEYQSVMTYKLFNIFSNNAQDKEELAQKSLALKVTKTPTTTDNTVNNTENNVVNNNVTNNTTNNVVNNTVNNVTNNTTNNTQNSTKGSTNNTVKNTSSDNVIVKGSDNTVAPTNLPKTGYRLIWLPIIAMIIVGLVFYKKYSKYNNYHE